MDIAMLDAPPATADRPIALRDLTLADLAAALRPMLLARPTGPRPPIMLSVADASQELAPILRRKAGGIAHEWNVGSLPSPDLRRDGIGTHSKRIIRIPALWVERAFTLGTQAFFRPVSRAAMDEALASWPDLLTTPMLAELLSISRGTARRMVLDGELPGGRSPLGRLVTQKADLAEHLVDCIGRATARKREAA